MILFTGNNHKLLQQKLNDNLESGLNNEKKTLSRYFNLILEQLNDLFELGIFT